MTKSSHLAVVTDSGMRGLSGGDSESPRLCVFPVSTTLLHGLEHPQRGSCNYTTPQVSLKDTTCLGHHSHLLCPPNTLGGRFCPQSPQCSPFTVGQQGVTDNQCLQGWKEPCDWGTAPLPILQLWRLISQGKQIASTAFRTGPLRTDSQVCVPSGKICYRMNLLGCGVKRRQNQVQVSKFQVPA